MDAIGRIVIDLPIVSLASFSSLCCALAPCGIERALLGHKLKDTTTCGARRGRRRKGVSSSR
jgi:hypothetical protein